MTSASGCQSSSSPAKSTAPALPSPLRVGRADVVKVPTTAMKRPHHTRPVKPAGKQRTTAVHPHVDSATVFNIDIDSHTLVNQPIGIDGTSYFFDSNTPTTAQLGAGNYDLRSYALSDAIGTFTVTDSGTVDYDASLEKSFSGRGTSTLTVLSYPVTIDASALTAQQFFLSYVGYFANQPATTFQLVPGGQYEVGLVARDPYVSGTFSVDSNGNVSYDPSLEGVVFSGNGTPTLTLTPAKSAVTISTVGLSESIAVNYIGYVDANSSQAMMLAAGSYSISDVASGGILGSFSVAADGTVSYAPTLNGVFAGQGSTTLSIIGAGKGITITGAQLTDQPLALAYVGYFDAHTPTLFQLSPGGPYTLWIEAEAGNQPLGSFNVTADGNVDYDDSLIGIFSGRGTPTLEILPARQNVIIDGGPLSPQDVALNFIGYFDSSSPYEVSLATGDYSISIPGQGNSPALGIFHVAVDGTVSYDAAYDSVFMGAGTNRIVINAVTFTIDGGQLPNRSFAVNSVTNWEPSSAQLSVSVAKGTYSIIEYGEVGITGYFTVGDKGIISYDPAYNGVFHGAGTSTLYLTAVAVGIDATRLTEQPLAIDGVTASFDSATPQTIAIAPGVYSVQQAGNDVATFTVFSDATVDYDDSLDGIFSGRQTNTLYIRGKRFTVNASADGPGNFNVSAIAPTFDRARAAQLDLLPGSSFTFGDDHLSFPFNLDGNGNVVYDSSLGNQVGGLGTRELMIGGYPTYDKVYGIATHNSYWLNRSDKADYFSSGTQELIQDQLRHEHVRFFEWDIHSEGVDGPDWKVYHTSDSEDFTCRYLEDCLEYLRQFQYENPEHEVINIMLELKNVTPNSGVYSLGNPTNPNFDAVHTPDALDNILRNALGDALYTPADFLAGCATGATMRECAHSRAVAQPQQNVWPTIDKLRGKFIFNLDGNASTAARDWALYSGGDMTQRVLFPMQSIFDITTGACDISNPGANGQADLEFTATDSSSGDILCVKDIASFPADFDPSPVFQDSWRQNGYNNSIFWQVEATWSSVALPYAAKLLAEGGVIRAHNAYEYGADCINDGDRPNCQQLQIFAGYQNIMTDFPWWFVDNTAWDIGLPTDPSRRFKFPGTLPDPTNQQVLLYNPAFRTINEPGSRLYFQTDNNYPGVWAYDNAAETSSRWLETTISSTRHGDMTGEWTQGGLPTVYEEGHSDNTCPGRQNPSGDGNCYNYPRIAQEDGEACIKAMSNDETQGIEICRQKNYVGPGASTALLSGDPSWDQETVDLYLRVFSNGKVDSTEIRAPRYAPCWSKLDTNEDGVLHACIGGEVALSIVNTANSANVVVFSASTMNGMPGTLQPAWVQIGKPASFTVPLTRQGYRGWRSELMTGVKVSETLNSAGLPAALHDITLNDLPVQEGATTTARVVDLSY